MGIFLILESSLVFIQMPNKVQQLEAEASNIRNKEGFFNSLNN